MLALLNNKALIKECCLQAYFVTNMEPIKFWDFVALILEGLGYGRYSYFMPLALPENFPYTILVLSIFSGSLCGLIMKNTLKLV